MFKTVIIWALILFTALHLSVNAEDNKKQENVPILIEADKLTYNNKQQVAIYIGDVEVRKGDFILWADKMFVFFNKDKNKTSDKSSGDIEKIEAVGNVRFKKGEYFGQAKKAEYYENGKFIKLIGNAKLKKGSNIIEGDLITYYLDTEEAFVSGKNRVRTIIINGDKGGK